MNDFADILYRFSMLVTPLIAVFYLFIHIGTAKFDNVFVSVVGAVLGALIGYTVIVQQLTENSWFGGLGIMLFAVGYAGSGALICGGVVDLCKRNSHAALVICIGSLVPILGMLS